MLASRRRALVVLTVAAGLLCAAAVGGVALLLRDNGNGESWSYYRVEQRQLKVFKTVRSCDTVAHAEVDETADRVEVAVHVDAGGVCGMDAVDKFATAVLGQPLGDRPVYDAVCLATLQNERECLRSVRSE